jgi:enoyl-CoA hydratase/carnithine racemase
MNVAHFHLAHGDNVTQLRLSSEDGANRLTGACVKALTALLHELAGDAKPLILCGNGRSFSMGADLSEIAALSGAEAYAFSRMGQELMAAIEDFPAPMYAAVEGHCMGGGLDVALACHRRVCSPTAVFGHRGAALGLMTGWGGTQRLSRVVGKGKALELFVAAEKVSGPEALKIGLVDAIAEEPVGEAMRRVRESQILDLRF